MLCITVTVYHQYKAGPDRYLTCGADYKQLREAVTQTLITKDPTVLTTALKVRYDRSVRLMCLCQFSDQYRSIVMALCPDRSNQNSKV